MQALAKKVGGDEIVVGLGLSLIQHLDGNIEGLKVLTTQVANELKFLRCLSSLCCWLRNDDRGELVHKTREQEWMALALWQSSNGNIIWMTFNL